MKKYILFIFLSLTIFGSIQAQQTVYVSGDNLNFRTDTVISPQNVITILKKATPLLLLSKSSDWAKVEYNGKTGYVSVKYISSTKPVVTQKKNESQVYICLSKSSYAYHSYYCHGLKRCKSGVSKVSVSEAKRRGYKACGNCY